MFSVPHESPLFLLNASNAFIQSEHAVGPLHALGGKTSMMDAGESHAALQRFASCPLNAATAPLTVAITPLVSDGAQSAGTGKSAMAAVRATMADLQMFNAFCPFLRSGFDECRLVGLRFKEWRIVDRAVWFADILERNRRFSDYAVMSQIKSVHRAFARYIRRAVENREVDGPRHVDERSERKVS
jgi:hypothetical protein